MTIERVPDNDRQERFAALPGQVQFPFDFPIFEAVDLSVYLARAGAVTELSQGGQYGITGVGETAGGSVVLYFAPLAGDVIIVRGEMAIGRTLQFLPGGDFLASVAEAEMNRLTIAQQEMRRDLARALTLPLDEDGALTLPPPAARAGRLMGFDATGTLIVTTTIPDLDIPLNAAIAAAAAAVTAAQGASADALMAQTARTAASLDAAQVRDIAAIAVPAAQAALAFVSILGGVVTPTPTTTPDDVFGGAAPYDFGDLAPAVVPFANERSVAYRVDLAQGKGGGKDLGSVT